VRAFRNGAFNLVCVDLEFRIAIDEDRQRMLHQDRVDGGVNV